MVGRHIYLSLPGVNFTKFDCYICASLAEKKNLFHNSVGIKKEI